MFRENWFQPSRPLRLLCALCVTAFIAPVETGSLNIVAAEKLERKERKGGAKDAEMVLVFVTPTKD